MSEQSSISIEPDPFTLVSVGQEFAEVIQFHPGATAQKIESTITGPFTISEASVFKRSLDFARSVANILGEATKAGAGSPVIAREQIKTHRAKQNIHLQNFVKR